MEVPAFLKIKAKLQGEISTHSSLPHTSFPLPFSTPSLQCWGIKALSLRFHRTPFHKLPGSPNSSPAPQLSAKCRCLLPAGGGAAAETLQRMFLKTFLQLLHCAFYKEKSCSEQDMEGSRRPHFMWSSFTKYGPQTTEPSGGACQTTSPWASQNIHATPRSA